MLTWSSFLIYDKFNTMSSFFSAKKLLLLGFVVIILVAIPVSVYILQQQQRTKSLAVASTHLFFNPSQRNITQLDQTADFAIMLNPTEESPPNQISFAKLIINYDPSIVSTDEAGFVLNKSAFSTVLEGPTFSSGSILVVLSVGADPSKAIKAQTKIADLKVKMLAKTDSTQITFANGTQVLSVSSSDEAGENVLARTTPATITMLFPTPGPTTQPISPTITVSPSVGGETSPSPPPTDLGRITLTGVTEQPTPTPTAIDLVEGTPTSTPTIVSIEPTGPSDNLIKIGITGLIISIIGGILFLVL